MSIDKMVATCLKVATAVQEPDAPPTLVQPASQDAAMPVIAAKVCETPVMETITEDSTNNGGVPTSMTIKTRDEIPDHTSHTSAKSVHAKVHDDGSVSLHMLAFLTEG